MRKLLKSEELLLNSCAQYTSLKELQTKEPHKYFMLKKHNLIKFLFPIHTCALPTNYVDPARLSNYKREYLELINELEAAILKARPKVEMAGTVNEVDKQYNKLKKRIKDLL